MRNLPKRPAYSELQTKEICFVMPLPGPIRYALEAGVRPSVSSGTRARAVETDSMLHSQARQARNSTLLGGVEGLWRAVVGAGMCRRAWLRRAGDSLKAYLLRHYPLFCGVGNHGWKHGCVVLSLRGSRVPVPRRFRGSLTLALPLRAVFIQKPLPNASHSEKSHGPESKHVTDVKERPGVVVEFACASWLSMLRLVTSHVAQPEPAPVVGHGGGNAGIKT